MTVDIQDLVDVPRETLEVELKKWLDLNDVATRASLARHIAAIANHGGGYLVIGFEDDLSHDPAKPRDLTGYSRDVFAAIVKRYLTPVFQCDVVIVSNDDGEEFPVVRIPGHTSVPVASKADGPQDERGRVQGIRGQTYYIRKPGPESAPITTAEEWAPLIRRCVLNDRDTLLRDLAGVVTSGPRGPDADQRLDEWHAEGTSRFLHLLDRASELAWPLPFKDHRYQLSYLISTATGMAIPENSLRRVLEEVNNEVRSTVWTGWSMFYPFNRSEIAPAFHPEHDDGTGQDVLEANLMGDGTFNTSLPDFWRVAPDGRATIVRAYREDRPRGVNESNLAAGTWLSPETILRETAELVTHARLMARRFKAVTKVSFRCTWMGLERRELRDFDPAVDWGPGQVAKADQRTVSGAWSVGELSGNWTHCVAELGCPILRLFGFADCTQLLVERMAPRFIKL